MPMMQPLIVAAVLVVSGSTSYFAQERTDLLAAVHLAAVQQVEGRRADISEGASAPFSGVLFDDSALGAVRDEVDSLRGEIASLRAALENQKAATETASFRADMWKLEAEGTSWDRFSSAVAKYGWAATLGAVVGLTR